MIEGLKPYPSTSHSDVDWIGNVPVHWEVRRLGQIGTLSKGSGGSKEDEVSTGIPCVRYGDLYTTHDFFIEKSRSFVSPDRARSYTPIRYGDLLFAASGETIDEIGKSAVNLIHSDACCGGDVILFRTKRQISPRYLGYAADCLPTAIQKAVMGRGITVIHIYADQLKRLVLTLPPPSEQTAIARFLDHATNRIDRYIRAKEKLVALLEEQIQVIINDAVTGRIDVRTGKPYATYKHSGVVWLREVPAHWEVCSLRRKLRDRDGIKIGPFGSQLKLEQMSQSGYKVFGQSNVIANDFRLGMKFIDEWKFKELSACALLPGDLAVTMMGTCGRCARVPDNAVPGILDSHLLRLRLRENDDAEFFARLIDEAPYIEEQLSVAGKGSIMHGLNSSIMKSLILAVPTPREQAAIARYLNQSTAKVLTAIDKIRRQIDLMQKYRTRLLGDVVTGKLDVQEAAALLPDDTSCAANQDGREALDADDELASIEETTPMKAAG